MDQDHSLKIRTSRSAKFQRIESIIVGDSLIATQGMQPVTAFITRSGDLLHPLSIYLCVLSFTPGGQGARVVDQWKGFFFRAAFVEWSFVLYVGI